MKKSNFYLNLGAWQECSTSNGPGRRFVLWVQGCPIRCPGCINPELQPFHKRFLVRVEEMAKLILSTPAIEGVTYTGGEPTTQARALVFLSEILREHNLTILCYTGYTLDEIVRKNDPWINRLLSLTDILIDGPYIQKESANLLWRGSRNQRVHFLTERYRHFEEIIDTAPAETEFIISDEGFLTIGTFPMELINKLKSKLKR